MADPRTKLDILYQDVLGEVAEQISRGEALAKKLDEVSQVVAQIPGTVNTAQAAATAKFRAEIEKATAAAVERLQSVVREATAAANVVDHAARRFAFLALLTGVLGGAVGGTLAAIVLYRMVSQP